MKCRRCHNITNFESNKSCSQCGNNYHTDTNVKFFEEFKYELFAIIRHAGKSSNYGHYISDIWDGEKWIQFDDDRATKLSDSKIFNCYDASTISNVLANDEDIVVIEDADVEMADADNLSKCDTPPKRKATQISEETASKKQKKIEAEVLDDAYVVLYHKVRNEFIPDILPPHYLLKDIEIQNNMIAKEHSKCEVTKQKILEEEAEKEKNAIDLIDALDRDDEQSFAIHVRNLTNILYIDEKTYDVDKDNNRLESKIDNKTDVINIEEEEDNSPSMFITNEIVKKILPSSFEFYTLQKELLCIHDKLDPLKIEFIKRVGDEALEVIERNYNDYEYKLLIPESFCEVCSDAKLTVQDKVDVSKDEFVKLSGFLSKNSKVENESTGFYIEKNWLSNIKRHRGDLKNLKFDKDINQKLLCPHRNLKTKKLVASLVSNASWESIHKLFPFTTSLSVSDGECPICKNAEDISLAEFSKMIESHEYLIINLKRLHNKTFRSVEFPNIKSDPPVQLLNLIPYMWMHSFFKYIDSSKFDISLLPGHIDTTSFLCPHSLIKFNPRDELECEGNKFFAITNEEYNFLGNAFTFTGPKLTVFRPVSATNIKDLDIVEEIEYKFNPELCHDCTNKRLEEEFENGFGTLIIAPVSSEKTSRRKAKSNKSYTISNISSDTSIFNFKMKCFELLPEDKNLCSVSQIVLVKLERCNSPIKNFSLTLKQCGIRNHDTLYYDIMDKNEFDDMQDMMIESNIAPEIGFKNSALYSAF